MLVAGPYPRKAHVCLSEAPCVPVCRCALRGALETGLDLSLFELLAEPLLLDCALGDFHLQMTAAFVATANNGWINIKAKRPGYVLPKEHSSTSFLADLCGELTGLRCLQSETRHLLDILYL